MLSNFTEETISAGGTGALTLSGAIDSAHITINNGVGVDHPFIYVARDGDNREIGQGHLSSATNLVRDIILETIVSGSHDRSSPSAVNLSTSATVGVSPTSYGVMPSFNQYHDSAIGGAMGASANLFATGVSDLSLAVSANTMYITPCFLSFQKFVTSVDIHVKTAVAAGELHIAAYTRGSDGRVGERFANFTSASTIDASTTGVKTATLPSPLLFPAGQFFIVILGNNGTIQVRAIPKAQSANHSMGMDAGGTLATMLTKGLTFATLPATIPTATLNSQGQFAFWLR